MRFSIKTLLALTTLVAVTLVCLMYPAMLLASSCFFAAVAAILIAIVAAVQLPGRRRAFALSFAIVAGGYLWLAMPSSQTRLISAQLGGSGAVSFDTPLLTTTLLYCWYDAAEMDRMSSNSPGRARTMQQFISGQRAISGGDAFEVVLEPSLESFLTIGHSAFAILFGYFGGVLGRRLQRKADDLFFGANPGG